MLQVFRLPPLPGLPPEELPQSLEECHRGLRHVNWHKMTYFEGTLTQNGGDCSVSISFPCRIFLSFSLELFHRLVLAASSIPGDRCKSCCI